MIAALIKVNKYYKRVYKLIDCLNHFGINCIFVQYESRVPAVLSKEYKNKVTVIKPTVYGNGTGWELNATIECYRHILMTNQDITSVLTLHDNDLIVGPIVEPEFDDLFSNFSTKLEDLNKFNYQLKMSPENTYEFTEGDPNIVIKDYTKVDVSLKGTNTLAAADTVSLLKLDTLQRMSAVWQGNVIGYWLKKVYPLYFYASSMSEHHADALKVISADSVNENNIADVLRCHVLTNIINENIFDFTTKEILK